VGIENDKTEEGLRDIEDGRVFSKEQNKQELKTRLIKSLI
jgi:predicted transcriptional regulator